jgi:hypothetical protein
MWEKNGLASLAKFPETLNGHITMFASIHAQ